MRRVKCYECGRLYNFDMDDFCPKCGAFNQPPRTTRIDADGSVVRVDGLNEDNHAESFVHEELHEENRARRRTGLSKGAQRTAAIRQMRETAEAVRSAGTARTAGTQKGGKKAAPGGLVFWVILMIVIFNLFSGVLTTLFRVF